MKTKICKICLIEKEITEFHKHKLGKFGVVAVCKLCVNNHIKRVNNIPTGMNRCSKCGELKFLTEFRLSKTGKFGVTGRCKICLNEYGKNYWALHKNETIDYKREYGRKYRSERKLFDKDKKLQKCFGITLDQYNQMFIDQNGVCAICGNPEKIFSKKINNTISLAVDHNHLTGEIRGLLCSDCNTSLGKFKDNIETLEKAINYLNKHKD